MSRLSPYTAAAAAMLALVAPQIAAAEMGLGIGVSWVFGTDGYPGGIAAGAKILADRDDGKITPAIGLDYVFSDQAIRPNISAVYQKSGVFADASFGYNLGRGGIDFGLGGGLSNSE